MTRESLSNIIGITLVVLITAVTVSTFIYGTMGLFVSLGLSFCYSLAGATWLRLRGWDLESKEVERETQRALLSQYSFSVKKELYDRIEELENRQKFTQTMFEKHMATLNHNCEIVAVDRLEQLPEGKSTWVWKKEFKKRHNNIMVSLYSSGTSKDCSKGSRLLLSRFDDKFYLSIGTEEDITVLASTFDSNTEAYVRTPGVYV